MDEMTILKRFENIKNAAKNDVAYKDFKYYALYEIETFKFLKKIIKDFEISLVSFDELDQMFKCVQEAFIHSAQFAWLREESSKNMHKKKLEGKSLSSDIIKASNIGDVELVTDLLIGFFGIWQDDVSAGIVRENLGL